MSWLFFWSHSPATKGLAPISAGGPQDPVPVLWPLSVPTGGPPWHETVKGFEHNSWQKVRLKIEMLRPWVNHILTLFFFSFFSEFFSLLSLIYHVLHSLSFLQSCLVLCIFSAGWSHCDQLKFVFPQQLLWAKGGNEDVTLDLGLIHLINQLVNLGQVCLCLRASFTSAGKWESCLYQVGVLLLQMLANSCQTECTGSHKLKGWGFPF